MSDDLADELRAFEGSDALGNGDFSVCVRGAAEITRLKDLVKETGNLAALRADKIEAQEAEITRLRARVAELRQIIRYVAGCEHATASDEDLLEQVAAAICRMNNIDPTGHISIDGSPFDWAWKHFLPQARAALEGKKE